MWHEQLLPGGLRPLDDGGRTTRDWAVDGFMFAGAVLLGLVVLGETEASHSELEMLLDILLGSLSVLAIWWRRRYPFVLALAVFAVSPIAASGAGAFLVLCFNAAIRVSMRQLLILCALIVVTAPIAPAVYAVEGQTTDYDWQGLIIGCVATVAAIAWGLFARARRDLVLSLHERAAELEAGEAQRMEQARENERRRIASEMHDVLAHRISLLSVHAGALEFRPDATPEEIAEAAGVIRQTARSALEELRSVVGILREDASTAPPQPEITDIPALLEESRAAGMHVTADVDLPDTAPPPGLGRTAYRIVQEGLTNARKHAPAVAVHVRLERADGALCVEVVSRQAVVAGPVAPGTGTGLIGLAERVELAGGTLEHGPDPDGDFHLRAVLPWPEA